MGKKPAKPHPSRNFLFHTRAKQTKMTTPAAGSDPLATDSPYQGQFVVIDITTEEGHRELQELVCIGDAPCWDGGAVCTQCGQHFYFVENMGGGCVHRGTFHSHISECGWRCLLRLHTTLFRPHYDCCWCLGTTCPESERHESKVWPYQFVESPM